VQPENQSEAGPKDRWAVIEVPVSGRAMQWGKTTELGQGERDAQKLKEDEEATIEKNLGATKKGARKRPRNLPVL